MEAMADTHVERKKIWQYCVAGRPNNFHCKDHTKTSGISMHPFPKKNKLKTKWINFVKTHRPSWEPSLYSSLYSAHFMTECFTHLMGSLFRRTLDRGLVLSTFDKPSQDQTTPKPRKRRLVS